MRVHLLYTQNENVCPTSKDGKVTSRFGYMLIPLTVIPNPNTMVKLQTNEKHGKRKQRDEKRRTKENPI